MKKKELFAISLLSVLVFVSFANIAVAAPPSYVGIKKGDVFIWRSSINTVSINTTAIALFGKENWTIMYETFLELYENNTGMEFDFLAGAGMKAVIQNVTDEIYPMMIPGINGSGVFFDFYVAYAANNWTLVSNSSMYTSPMIYFIDPSALNKSTIMYGMMGTPLFMSKGYNYSMYADVTQDMIDATPGLSGNVTFLVHGNGFKVTYKAAYLEYMFETMGAPFDIGTLKDLEIIIRWNSNGVFDYTSLAYDSLTLATANLVTADDDFFIPGYELVTILGVSLATFIALVYTIRKKRILK